MPAGNACQYIIEINQVWSAETGCIVPAWRSVEAKIAALRYIEVRRQASRVVSHVVENERTREEYMVLLYKRLIHQGHACCPDGRGRACAAASAGAVRECLPLATEVERQIERD